MPSQEGTLGCQTSRLKPELVGFEPTSSSEENTNNNFTSTDSQLLSVRKSNHESRFPQKFIDFVIEGKY